MDMNALWTDFDQTSLDYTGDRLMQTSENIRHADPPPLGKHTWGENVTCYGGIGKLPFLGRGAKSRDLDVSRGHEHYGSGFSKYESKIQPYRLTPLRLSDCRLNDQMLPRCFTEYLDPKKYVIPAAPPKQPYYSHKSRFEVFPINDPKRKNKNGMPVLNPRTSDALEDYHRYLYFQPLYHEDYDDNSSTIKQNLAAKHKIKENISSHRREAQRERENLSASGQLTQSLTEAPGPYSLAHTLLLHLSGSTLYELAHALSSLITGSRETTNDIKKEACRLALMSERILQECITNVKIGVLSVEESKERLCHFLKAYRALAQTAGDGFTGSQARIYSSDVDCKETLMGQRTISSNIPKAPLCGIEPLWPPGRSYFMDKKMRLKEIESLTNGEYSQPTENIGNHSAKDHFSKKANSEFTSNQDYESFLYWKDLEKNPQPEIIIPISPGFPQYKKYLDNILPVKLEYDEDSPDSCQYVPEYTEKRTEPNTNSPVTESQDRNQPTETPLSAFLKPTGNRIQDRLGLKFKTEAHRRYHRLYPDKVPDLRENQIQRKRYFFYGYHASAFRG